MVIQLIGQLDNLLDCCHNLLDSCLRFNISSILWTFLELEKEVQELKDVLASRRESRLDQHPPASTVNSCNKAMCWKCGPKRRPKRVRPGRQLLPSGSRGVGRDRGCVAKPWGFQIKSARGNKIFFSLNKSFLFYICRFHWIHLLKVTI